MSLPSPHFRRHLRPALKELLEAHPLLAPARVPVFIDDLPAGEPYPMAQETALRTKGAMITLPVVLGSQVADYKTGVVSLDCELSVILRTVPLVLAAQPDPRPVDDLVDAVVQAVLGGGASPAMPRGVFQPAKEFIRYDLTDVGCTTYAFSFVARVPISTTAFTNL